MQLLSLSCVICISGEPRRYTWSKKGGGMRKTKGETTRSEETESEAEGLRRERRWRRCGGSAATLNPAWQGELRRDRGVRYEGGEETKLGHHDNRCSQREADIWKGCLHHIYHTGCPPPQPKPSTPPSLPSTGPPINRPTFSCPLVLNQKAVMTDNVCNYQSSSQAQLMRNQTSTPLHVQRPPPPLHPSTPAVPLQSL